MKTQSSANDPIRPLHVPAEHHPNAPFTERVVYALADLGEGNAVEVATRLTALGSDDANEEAVQHVLDELFNRGLINGTEDKGQRRYNLAKETRPHTGKVDPDNLSLS